MKKVVRLTESELTNLIRKVINEQETKFSTKGSLIDIAKKDFFHKDIFKQEYKWMMDPEHVWEVTNSRGSAKIAGNGGNLAGKYFKSKDFIDLTGGGEITFVTKGDLKKIQQGTMLPMFGVVLGNKGIGIAAYWD